jgi:hypothetical protein
LSCTPSSISNNKRKLAMCMQSSMRSARWSQAHDQWPRLLQPRACHQRRRGWLHQIHGCQDLRLHRPMAHNWGANWHSMAYLSGKRLSFRITITMVKHSCLLMWCRLAGPLP